MQVDEVAEYLLDLGGALLAAGCPTHRLEQAIGEIAGLQGLTADVFAVPTGLFLSVAAPGQAPVTRMRRVSEWGLDLGRLATVDEIFNDVLAQRCTLAEARARLVGIERLPPTYPAPLQWLAAAGTAGATAVFFRGGLREVLVAAAGGLAIAAMRALLARPATLRPLQDFLGGLLVGLIAWSAGVHVGHVSREVIVLAIVILLVPGMALTTGLAELVHKNLVSGGAKLMEAGMTLLSIVCGIAAVVALERLVGGGHAIAVRVRPEPGWLVNVVALLVSAFSVAVLFSVPRRLLALAMLSVAVGWIVTGLGGRTLPGSITAFGAALAVSVFANVVARVTDRPAQVFQVPGLVLLVPGSFGFLSLDAFLAGEFAGGAAKAFEMFMVAAAIVTGLVVAQVVFPARKLL